MPLTTALCTSSSRPVDLVFVLDSSSTLGEANWRLALAFASSIVDLLTIGERDTRYAYCRDVAFDMLDSHVLCVSIAALVL